MQGLFKASTLLKLAAVAAQIVAPLLITAWMMLPPASWAEFAARVGAAGAALIAALLSPGWWMTSLWWRRAIPPLFAVATLAALIAHRPAPPWPKDAVSWAPLVITLAVLGYLVLRLRGFFDWRESAGAALDIALPFQSGAYVLAAAGSAPARNQHAQVLRDPSLRRLRGQGLGADLIGVNRWGRHSSRIWPRRLDDFEIYGRAVHAPCDGTVLSVEDGLEDRAPGERRNDPPPGNHIWLQPSSRPDASLLLAHLQKGSVRVRAGQTVVEGERVGAVGNSGNSTEPHLHVHVQDAAPAHAPFDGDPRPMTIDGRRCAPNAVLRATRRL